MDVFAHAVYGATVCSRTGMAGGSKAHGRRWIADWTLWTAALFGILPDALSMGLPFLAFWQAGMPDNFFHNFGGEDIVRYRYAHSLIIALAVSLALRLAWKPLFIPSLAWPLHVVMDAFTHGPGKFHTTLFYPLSDGGPNGIRWWEHPYLVLAYWLALPAIWLGLQIWRRRTAAQLTASAL
jgi:hypothetical protein